MTKNLIKSIVQTYPNLAEKYADFLLSLNMSFDEDVNKTDMDIENAEKFIISFKLQKYVNKLENEKKQLLNDALNSNDFDKEKLQDLDSKLVECNRKLQLLLDTNK